MIMDAMKFIYVCLWKYGLKGVGWNGMWGVIMMEGMMDDSGE